VSGGFFVLPIVIAALVYMWVGSVWAALAVGTTVLWLDVRMGVLIQSVRAFRQIVAKESANELRCNYREQYKGPWPL